MLKDLRGHGGGDGGQKENVAATVPLLFLKEAGSYIDTVLATLRADKPDAVVHDFAGIAGTMAAEAVVSYLSGGKSGG